MDMEGVGSGQEGLSQVLPLRPLAEATVPSFPGASAHPESGPSARS